MKRAVRWLLREIFGYRGDHDWLSVWMDSVVTLTDGTPSAGYLMMRVHKGKTEYRHMNAEEELEQMRSGESL